MALPRDLNRAPTAVGGQLRWRHRRIALVCAWLVLQPLTSLPAQEPSRSVSVIKSQYLRLAFGREIQRIAIGDQDIASADVVTNREVLVLGKDIGRTTLIVWFLDGGLDERVIAVKRDLSLLVSAVKQVHSSIEVDIAPDRDVVVLTGRVPEFGLSFRAQQVAQAYLDSATQSGPRNAGTAGTAQPAGGLGSQSIGGSGLSVAVPLAGGGAIRTDSVQVTASSAQVGQVLGSGSVINLIQVENLPQYAEQKIAAAIGSLGGEHVTIRRVLKGNIRDDSKDTLVLEGSVRDQIALVRILQVAAQLFADRAVTAEELQVVADEAGGLTSRTQNSTSIPGAGSGSSFTQQQGLGAISSARALRNEVVRNLGRATAISAAEGRILSFIRVADLPQVRVNIRLFEINRERLKSYAPALAEIRAGDLSKVPTSLRPQTGSQAPAPTATKEGDPSWSVKDVLTFLAGGRYTNELQFIGSKFAIAQAIALLERDGIARTLSSPTLTVLSGESAEFQVGGAIPIPTLVLPQTGQNAGQQALLQQVDFRPFGIGLEIRPLVGDDDTITLDVAPQVITPDPELTASIVASSGTNQQTTAFATRLLKTSARLPDGQTLLIGGLTTRDASFNAAKPGGLGDVPGLGWLFKSFNQSDTSRDLVIVVNPVILRTRIPNVPLWAFPTTDEMLKQFVGAAEGATTSPPIPRSPS